MKLNYLADVRHVCRDCGHGEHEHARRPSAAYLTCQRCGCPDFEPQTRSRVLLRAMWPVALAAVIVLNFGTLEAVGRDVLLALAGAL